MSLGSADRRREGLRVGWIALALVVAAFLGASLGLVWQTSGLGEGDDEMEQAASAADDDAQDSDVQEEEDGRPTPPTSA